MSDRFEFKRAFEVAEFKAIGTKGEFSALVSVFGNVDYGGDRVVKGAFSKSLAQWREKGDPVPIIWNHMWDNPDAHIGEAHPDDLEETDKGLMVNRGKLDVDRPFAGQVHHLLDRRRVKEFSFGYNLRDAQKAKDGALDLLDIDLFEFGPTLKGMNPETELLAVKALAAATDPVAVGEPGEELHVPRQKVFVIPDLKAGARHSKATRDLVQSTVDALSAHFLSDDTTSETPKADEAEAKSKASDPVAEDIQTRIRILMED